MIAREDIHKASNVLAVRGNHNFFSTATSPAFQEISLLEFSNGEYSVFSFLSYVSRGRIELFIKDGSYFVYSIE